MIVNYHYAHTYTQLLYFLVSLFLLSHFLFKLFCICSLLFGSVESDLSWLFIFVVVKNLSQEAMLLNTHTHTHTYIIHLFKYKYIYIRIGFGVVLALCFPCVLVVLDALLQFPFYGTKEGSFFCWPCRNSGYLDVFIIIKI